MRLVGTRLTINTTIVLDIDTAINVTTSIVNNPLSGVQNQNKGVFLYDCTRT